MKKILLSAVATILMAGTAMAEGYQINSLSTKQIGMGHTGVALKLGAENMYFNPAGMAYMDKTLDLTGSFTGIMPTATATVDGKEYELNFKDALYVGRGNKEVTFRSKDASNPARFYLNSTTAHHAYKTQLILSLIHI